MKIFSDGQFSIGTDTYVFAPRHEKQPDRFIPVRKTKGKDTSDIYLSYASFPTQDFNLREFRMFLLDKHSKLLQLDGKSIECKGNIYRIDCHYNDVYRQRVRDMLEKAAEVYRKQVEARAAGLEFIGDLAA